jgi:hypothetical protein
MKFKSILFLIAGICTQYLFAQAKTTEIGIITDNDLYTSSKNDMYYTNGLTLFYRFLDTHKKENVNKNIVEFKIGQYIYNPRYINVNIKEKIDRPYAGYLFADVGKGIFYKSESVFKADVQLGFVGPNSFAEQVQKGLHQLVGYKEVRGWQYQVKNALAVQTQFLYSKKLFSNQKSEVLDLHFKSEAQLGTIFTSASIGILSRIGFKKLTAVYNSNLYNASVNSYSQQIPSEFYFYIAPSLSYQLYDATIQGSLFNDTSPQTFSIVPFRFNGEAGFKYRKNNLNLSYVFVYRGKELYINTSSGYFYGSIGVSYLLK